MSEGGKEKVAYREGLRDRAFRCHRDDDIPIS